MLKEQVTLVKGGDRIWFHSYTIVSNRGEPRSSINSQLCWDKGQEGFYGLGWASGKVLEEVRRVVHQWGVMSTLSYSWVYKCYSWCMASVFTNGGPSFQVRLLPSGDWERGGLSPFECLNFREWFAGPWEKHFLARVWEKICKHFKGAQRKSKCSKKRKSKGLQWGGNMF